MMAPRAPPSPPGQRAQPDLLAVAGVTPATFTME